MQCLLLYKWDVLLGLYRYAYIRTCVYAYIRTCVRKNTRREKCSVKSMFYRRYFNMLCSDSYTDTLCIEKEIITLMRSIV